MLHGLKSPLLLFREDDSKREENKAMKFYNIYGKKIIEKYRYLWHKQIVGLIISCSPYKAGSRNDPIIKITI